MLSFYVLLITRRQVEGGREVADPAKAFQSVLEEENKDLGDIEGLGQ